MNIISNIGNNKKILSGAIIKVRIAYNSDMNIRLENYAIKIIQSIPIISKGS